jgi:asparagine synthase (glutamine-hydrolysing)
MCGIFGHIGFIDKNRASRCLNTLTHRGPDGAGLWHHPEITLGHRRLSILDLSERGKQPMSYADGRYWITFNGEIYNFIEIRDELIAKGHVFLSDTDTEVILAAFVTWGEDCLEKFNGMWAFAIWDCQNKTLFMARDRFGKKPLFYTQTSSGLAFASEMKALFPLLKEVRPNLSIVKDSRRIMQYETTDECVVAGIKRFPAGHFGWYRDGRLSLRRWWCTLDNLAEAPARYEEQVEQFRALFLDACRLRMRSDVPIGTALSGGLDSSSVISAVASIGNSSGGARINRDWQHAFIAAFPESPLDETYYAKMVTSYLGIDPIIIDIDPLKAIGKLDEYLFLFEDLYITSPIPFMMTYGKMKEQGIKVTIDGHGADESFGGYSFDYLSTLKDGGLNLSKVRMILSTYYDAYPKDSGQFYLPSKVRFWLEWQARRLAKRLLRRSATPSTFASHADYAKLDTLNQQLYISVHETVLPTLLRNYDRYSMAHGVEIRMPFMDHRIISLAFAIPWTSKIRQGFSKAIVRDAMAPFMPHEVAYRKSKIGFNSPIVDWLKGPLKPFFLDILESQSFKTCELIDPVAVAAKIRRVIDEPQAKFQEGEQAWTLLSPYLWEQAVLKRAQRESPFL